MRPTLSRIPSQQQQWPGTTAELSPAPDHGENWIGRNRLPGKRVLITGGDSGIGRAIALTMAKEGARVAISHLPQEQQDADDITALIADAGGECHTFATDLTDRAANDKLADDAITALGGVDVLVANAAYQMTYDSLEEFPPEPGSTDEVSMT